MIIYQMILLNFLLLGGATGFICPLCTPSHCAGIITTGCPYGVVKEDCGCCDMCGVGPGHMCDDGLSVCGNGLECVERVAGFPTTHYNGICKFIANGRTFQYF